MTKIHIFTGKGGVGKTSVAAAHARLSSRLGERTLIVSTDMAHNLGDIFQVKLGKTPIEVESNLYVLEIDPNYSMNHEFVNMKKALEEMISSSGIPVEEIDNMNMFPGMDELMSLLKLIEIYESGDYDRIIVDCAPTGETLALLKFPELMSWYVEKFFPLGKVAMRIMKPVTKMVYKIDLPNHKALTDIEKVFVRLVELQNLLKDKSITSIRLVTIPEKMVVEETKRSFMYLNLYNYGIDGVFINRILPRDIENPFFDEWLSIQNHYIDELESVFTNIPCYRIPWFDTDINGIEGIDKIVDQVLIKEDVYREVSLKNEEQYFETEDGYSLVLHIPGVDKGKVDIHESAVDVIIKIGNFKRNIPKPNSLRKYQISGAKYEDDRLRLSFVER